MDSTGNEGLYRELLESVTDASRDLIYFKDTDRRLVHVGQTYANIFDADPDDLHGKQTEELWPDQAAAMIADEQRVLRGERITDRERKVSHPDGTEHWYSVNKIPRYDDTDTIIGFFGIDREITERKERQRELEITQNRFKALTEHTNLGVLTMTKSSTIRYVNQGAAGIFGYDPEELIGESLLRLIPETHQDDHTAGLAAYLQSGTKHVDWGWTEVPGLRSNGEIVPLGLSFGETKVNGERRFTAVIRDISHQKERKAELQTMRRAVEEAGLAIFITDDSGTIEYVNPAFEVITGYASEEAVGNNPRILQSGELDDEYYERMWEAILNGELWQEEIPNRRKSGELYYAHQTIAPIIKDGHVRKFVAIQQDITERKERDQHLQVFNRVLRHNHRNLLNSVLGAANSIDPTFLDEDARFVAMVQEMAAELHELSEKAYRLTTLLMEDSNQSRSFDLEETLSTITEEFERTYSQAKLSTSVSGDVTVLAHQRFELAIKELLENAIDHNDAKRPSVEIDVERTEGKVIIGIEDNGPGIPKHEYTIITGESEITQVDHGSGLGLWLAYWIVRRSGGELQFEVTSQGTTVRIELPLVQEPGSVDEEMGVENRTGAQQIQRMRTRND